MVSTLMHKVAQPLLRHPLITYWRESADLGVAFDGDGDRTMMVDHLGNVVDGDEILYIIARERRFKNINFGGVVGTKMSNLGLELHSGPGLSHSPEPLWAIASHCRRSLP